MDIRERANAAWEGERVRPAGTAFEEVAPGHWLYLGFSNVCLRETGDGLVVLDPGAFNNARAKYDALRAQFHGPVHTIIYSHGHADHCFGADRYAAEAREQGWRAPRVIAHENTLGRFERYRTTNGWNAIINNRQFQGGTGTPSWPMDWYPPDITYRDELALEIGGVPLVLRHARGETDDATWAWWPSDRVAWVGDLFIWNAPNCGNPQKVQRYAADWAAALREIAAVDPEVLLPGHGMPLFGAARIRQALGETAEYLESLHAQVVALMNRGATLDEVIHTVRPPAHLADRPYLRPAYDEPEFIVRNIWRLYGGWWDGIPSHLKPAPEVEQARVIAELAGGASRVAERAQQAAAAGDLRLARHLADWAAFAAPDDAAIRETRRQVYEASAAEATSTMAIGVFGDVARQMGAEHVRGAGALWRMSDEP